MRKLTAFLCLLLLFLPHSLSAGPKPKTVPWDQLEPLILGERVTIKLADGTIDGHVIEIKPDALSVDVERSTNRAALPVGTMDVARTAFTTISMHHRRRFVRPLSLVLSLGIIVALDHTVLKDHRSIGTALAVGFGVGFGSTWLTRKLADKVTIITIGS